MVNIAMNTNGHASDTDFSHLAKKLSLGTPLIKRIAADTSIAVEHDINTANASDLICLVFNRHSRFFIVVIIPQYRPQYF